MPTNTPMTSEELDRLARKRAGAKMGWFFHATVYVIVNLFVFAMSQYAFGTRSWSLFPLLGWGMGLALHGVSVWLMGAGGDFRERMVQKEREHLQRQNDQRNGS